MPEPSGSEMVRILPESFDSKAADEPIPYANRGARCLKLRNRAEREGFEPSVRS
jgi:hypothetical protein